MTTTRKRSPSANSATGITEILFYCRDHRCSHHTEASADGWADDVRLSDVEPSFTCARCGKRGADIRPKFRSAEMGVRENRAEPPCERKGKLRAAIDAARRKTSIRLSDARSQPSLLPMCVITLNTSLTRPQLIM